MSKIVPNWIAGRCRYCAGALVIITVKGLGPVLRHKSEERRKSCKRIQRRLAAYDNRTNAGANTGDVGMPLAPVKRSDTK